MPDNHARDQTCKQQAGPKRFCDTCCWQVYELPVGCTSVHPAVECGGDGDTAGAAAGEAAGAPGHLPQVVWQKPPSSMKEALHLPNAFCKEYIQDESYH